MKGFLRLFVVLIVMLSMNSIFAQRGCCSWHGGQSYCDPSSGRIVCKDGTYSPSCMCASYSDNDTKAIISRLASFNNQAPKS